MIIRMIPCVLLQLKQGLRLTWRTLSQSITLFLVKSFILCFVFFVITKYTFFKELYEETFFW